MTYGAPTCVGVVAEGHPETARAGADVLAAGGNAVDAACAAAAAAGIAESPLTGPGAGGFMLVRTPDGDATLLDFFVEGPGRGPFGQRLDPDMLDSFVVPFGGAEQQFHIGAASVAVPGMVQGIAHAVAGYGCLPLGEVLQPAMRLARQGVRITPQIAYLFEILEAMLRHSPESERIFAPDGHILRAGDTLRIPQLADTFDEIARHGAASLRDGAIANAIVGHLADQGGLVTAEDFAGYAVIEREPLRLERDDVELITNPPPSAGGVLILSALTTIAPDQVVDEASFYQALADAGMHANALRTDGFIESLHAPDIAEALLARPSRKPTGTTNVAVVDADGMMVSLSSSCGSGSGVVVPETGILLNNMLGEEDLNPGGFGQVQPGMRMTSMMAPTVAVKRGTPMVALGSAGSNRLRSAILQTLVDVIDRGRSVHDAVDLPRIHPERDGIDVEFGVPNHVCDALSAGGYRLRRWQGRNLFFGGVSAVSFVDGRLDGAGDPRRGGAAAGVTHDGEVVDL